MDINFCDYFYWRPDICRSILGSHEIEMVDAFDVWWIFLFV